MEIKGPTEMNSDQIINGALYLVKVATAFVIAQWAGISVGPQTALKALVFFRVVDWITGFAAAWVNGQVNSDTGRKGATKKGLTLLLILTIHVAEKLAGFELNLELWGGTLYAINELISIVENMDKAGVDIPKPLVAALIRVKGLGPGRASKKDLEALKDAAQDTVDAATRTQAVATKVAENAVAEATGPATKG